MPYAPSNVSFSLDNAQLLALDKDLAKVGKTFDRSVTGRVLRQALKPTLQAVKRNAPVGKNKARSSATRRGRGGKVKRDGTYDRGGATRRDARILIVNGVGTEVVRGLVGISKSRGHVGWRTHLITRANLHRKVADDFLSKSEKETERDVERGFADEATNVVQKVLSKYS